MSERRRTLVRPSGPELGPGKTCPGKVDPPEIGPADIEVFTLVFPSPSSDRGTTKL
ncbi:MAG: hypothetical protein WAL56_05730 [Candidatus Sulfotelmatobacter sp.]